jgi:hypothetical protein
VRAHVDLDGIVALLFVVGILCRSGGERVEVAEVRGGAFVCCHYSEAGGLLMIVSNLSMWMCEGGEKKGGTSFCRHQVGLIQIMHGIWD